MMAAYNRRKHLPRSKLVTALTDAKQTNKQANNGPTWQSNCGHAMFILFTSANVSEQNLI